MVHYKYTGPLYDTVYIFMTQTTNQVMNNDDIAITTFMLPPKFTQVLFTDMHARIIITCIYAFKSDFCMSGMYSVFTFFARSHEHLKQIGDA